MRWPNPRQQRTPSAAPPSPLSRKPLGPRSWSLRMRAIAVACLVVALIAISVANASPPEKKAWPELPTSGFVAGRQATEEDVKAGNAVFVLRSGGRLVGTPLKLQ